MGRGRPSIYTEELQAKADEYVDSAYAHEEPVPTLAGLADYIDVHRDTIYDWDDDEKKPDFSYTLEKIRRKQERMLLAGGLRGDLNPTITKLGLAANHGYHDKKDVENSGQIYVIPDRD